MNYAQDGIRERHASQHSQTDTCLIVVASGAGREGVVSGFQVEWTVVRKDCTVAQ